VPFAGHPVIGTAVALHEDGGPARMVLELGVGPLQCTVAGNRARFVTRRPLERVARPDPGLVARALSLPATAIRDDRHAPVQAGLGLPFVLVELADPGALAAAEADVAAIREGARLHPAGLDFAIFCYVRDGDRIDARMFAPLDGVPEDPATGSASAALAALLGETHGASARFAITPGVAMGRPSEIEAEVVVEAGRAASVAIAGAAVRVMEGRLV
jgi:trans-2,3-dihydro-3-hydroxyanthranilate isomerase